LLSAGSVKQANAAEVFILSKQSFKLDSYKLGRKLITNGSKQGKQKHANLFKGETAFHNRVTIYQVSNKDLKHFPFQLH